MTGGGGFNKTRHMKIRRPGYLPVLLTTLLVTAPAARLAAFEVPRYVFDFDRLAEAQSEAYEDKKPLLLLYADPKKNPT